MLGGMCIFSGKSPALRVERTQIFARRHGAHQVLVYAMHLAAPEDAAMILPLPVAPGAGDDAVRMHDLSSVPDFFARLDRCFPRDTSAIVGERAQSRPRLPVRTVGAFEASYVPSLSEFDRLDPRFRIPESVWRMLPLYRDWGFAVFIFRPGSAAIHPMALDFPMLVPDALFFPTVHVHDGQVHARAAFDHTLYVQGLDRIRQVDRVLDMEPPRTVWTLPRFDDRSELNPRARFDERLPAGLVELDSGLSRLRLRRDLPNTDVWLTAAPEPTIASVSTIADRRHPLAPGRPRDRRGRRGDR